MRKSRFLFLVASVALAAVLLPGIAWASSLTTSAQGGSALETQAATKTVYVISSWTAYADGSSRETTIPRYYKNGLLKSVSNGGWSNAFRFPAWGAYKYDSKGNLKTMKNPSLTAKFKTSTKGRITVEKRYLADGKQTGSMSYKWKSGKARSYTGSSWGSSRSGSIAYKNGRVSRIKDGLTYKYSYDSHGNLKAFRTYMGSTGLKSITWKNTYDKSGRLKTSAATASSYRPCKVMYKYKAIKVPASMASKVKAQQWALVNDNLNLALGGVLSPGILDYSVFGEG